ncbi:hypothetical protein KTO58_04435 [Chitinophaga pendula]|uniref:transposase-like zinc-binding domain-containing protein n=1 Tax=Chitinophaga TaxID=79328 RepID=UPI000BB04FB6|nr:MULTISPECIES: hypothetical protein [Chitinophaga]ASZ13937.1 hypothetical protein CK934_24765 [Chitinophaga sp. MD30]UCJ08443.1 hypothetical protein KTO58_04435 [Chitinophaga pendula]
MTAGTPTYCPHCGSSDITIYGSPDHSGSQEYTCRTCHRSFRLQSPSLNDSQLEKLTVDICLKNGYLAGIHYYITHKSQQLGTRYSLAKAKQEVDELLASRGLSDSVKKKRSGIGCLLVIILASIALAVYYFFLKK